MVRLASVVVSVLALLTAGKQQEGWAGLPPEPGAVRLSWSGSQPEQWPENWVESGWKLGKASFLAVALLVRTPEEHCEKPRGRNQNTLSTHIQRLWRERRRSTGAYPELDLAGSDTGVELLLFTADTGGGEMGVVGSAGVVGVTGVTGVGGMLESLRLIWLCSEGPLRPFMELSLLLDF